VTWQRVTRFGFAVAGLGCAVAVGVRFRGRPLTVAAPSPVKRDPAATVEGGRGNTLQWGRDGKEDYRLDFASMAEYPDGRSRFTQAHFTSAKGDRGFDIRADEAETQGKGTRGAGPANVNLSGDVRITTSDHWVIHSTSAIYADAIGLVTMPGPMTFARDRMTGDGQGATYDRFNGVLTILDRAHIASAADESRGGALDATASRMSMARPQKSARLDGMARLERDKEILSADAETLLFTDDEKGLKQLDMRGHARVTPKPGAADAPPDMRAETIGLLVYPDGRTLQHATLRGHANVQLMSATGAKTIAAPAVDLDLAKDGQTLTRLDGTGGVTVQLPPTPDTPSARTITAPMLVSTGDEKAGLKTSQFTGGVTFVEHAPAAGATPASDRTANSKVLVLKLNGDLGAVDEAEFRQDVHFTDGDVTAVSEHATYAEAKSLLTLDAAGSHAQPVVVNGTVKVLGDLVRLATDTHDMDARGNVQTKSTPSPASSGTKPASPGLFDADQPVFGASVRMQYESAKQRATYFGSDAEPADVYQTANQNKVRGDMIVVEQASNNLRATGRVTSVFATDPKPATGSRSAAPPGPPTVYYAKAQELDYLDATRTAHYVGGSDAAELRGPDGTTTAHMIDVVLAQATRSVDRMVADGDVHLTSDAGREARGDHLTYDAASDQYHLIGVIGAPALAVLPQSKADGAQPQCMLYTAKELTFAGNGFAAATAGGDPVKSTNWPCGKPIK
jgi:lipopolysaccharide export system protein LptA